MSLKVLMYGWEFPPHISGGLGVACYDLTKSLSAHNIDVTFVLPKLKTTSDEHLHLKLIGSSDITLNTTIVEQYFDEELHAKLKFLKIDSFLNPYLTESSYREFLEKYTSRIQNENSREHFYQVNLTGQYGPDLLNEVWRYAQIAGVIAKQVDHDLIHVHDWLTVLAGVQAKKISKKPLIYHVHALETDRSGRHLNQQVYQIEKLGLEEADKIIAVSYYTRNNIIEHYGINPDKISVVHNAVSKEKNSSPLKRFKKRPGEKMVLFVGRVTYQKGPDYFLEAAAKVLSKQPNVRFVIAGMGDMLHRLIERAAELKIGRNVHFTGFLRRSEVEDLFAAADAYVMSSVSEPFGISCLEAVLYDVPVIISKQSGVSEVLKHSLKVDFWDTKDLANKIYSVINYPALQKELYIQAAEELKNIQWETSAAHVIDVYKSLVKD